MMKQRISIGRLKELLRYDPSTGQFVWRVKLARKIVVGTIAGCTRSDGYVIIKIEGVNYFAHRLAWFYMTGAWPEKDVDHKVGKSNRWTNIRAVTRTVNMQNMRHARITNKTGLLGVDRHRDRFKATIRVDGERRYLGTFDTADAAHKAYVEAKRQLHLGCTI